MLDSGSDSNSESDFSSDSDSDTVFLTSIEDVIKYFNEKKLQEANAPTELNGQNAASNHVVIDTKAVTPTTHSTPPTSQQQPHDQQPNRQKNDAARACEHSSSIQACGPERRRKRRRSDYVSETDSQGGESPGKFDIHPIIIEIMLTVSDTAIVVEDETPRRRRKTNHKKFYDHVDRENFWMVRTMRHIKKALKVCDELDQDIDKEQERQDKWRQKLKEQRKILEGITKYIISCGANEQKITRRWEKSQVGAWTDEERS